MSTHFDVFSCECSRSASKASLFKRGAACNHSGTFLLQLHSTRLEHTDYWGGNLWFATCPAENHCQWKACTLQRKGRHSSITRAIYWCSCWQHPFIDLQNDSLRMTWTESQTMWAQCQYCWQDPTAALVFLCSRKIRGFTPITAVFGSLEESSIYVASLLFIYVKKEFRIADLDRIEEHFDNIVKITNTHNKP